MKVLIAEDEANILTPYKIILESKGHQVFTAEDGISCMKIYKEELEKLPKNSKFNPFDVVLLDYRMPKKDGLQVAKEIFELVLTQRIVFVSAYVKTILIDSTSSLPQVVEMLQKPFELDVLVDIVAEQDILNHLKEFGIGLKGKTSHFPNHNELVKLLESLLEMQKKYDMSTLLE